jgi:PAS domain S-box-containing protein
MAALRMSAEHGSAAMLRWRIADAVLDAAGDAIIACDADGIIRFWNLGASRIFGFDAAEAIGQSLDIVIPERLQTRHWEGFHRMITTGQSRYPQGHLLSAPGRRKDGSQVSVEFTAVALEDGGKVVNIIAVMRDVTARFEEIKALRRQLRDAASG